MQRDVKGLAWIQITACTTEQPVPYIPVLIIKPKHSGACRAEMTLRRSNRLLLRVAVHDCSVHSAVPMIITDQSISVKVLGKLGSMSSPDIVFPLSNLKSGCVGAKID